MAIKSTLLGLARTPNICRMVRMRTSIDIDRDLENELTHASSITREKKATVIRLALRAGLPLVINRFQAPRPEGYFTSDYPLPKDRLKLEAAMAKVKKKRKPSFKE